MLKFFYFLFTSPLGLPINPLWEWAILLIFETIAYVCAYAISSGGNLGSAIHWTVRLFIFVILWLIAYGIIYLIKLIFENWIIILSVLGGAILVGGIITAIVLSTKKKREKQLKAK